MATNTVKYGLRNVYYALATKTATGSLNYEAPIRWPGAVSLSFSPEGGQTKFYADDGVYFSVYDNNGYSGSMETALIPDTFREWILGETLDENGVLVETKDSETHYFALLFQFTGDRKNTRHVLYGCTASRPDVASSTRAESTEVQTETLNIEAGPVLFGDEYYVKAKTTEDVDDTVYAAWFTEVYLPSDASPTPYPSTTITWFIDWDDDEALYTITFGVKDGYPVMVLESTSN